MAYPGLQTLKDRVNTLAELEQKLLAYVENISGDDELLSKALLDHVEAIDLKSCIYMFSAFLHLIACISITRPGVQSLNSKISSLLLILQTKYDFKSMFPPTIIFDMFERNKLMLLYLYQIGIIDLETLKKKMYSELFIYFFPEIKEADPTYFRIQGENYYISKACQYLDNIDEFKRLREEGHSEDPVSKLIRNDDLNAFIDFLSKNNYSLDSMIGSSIFEPNAEIRFSGPSVIEYAMIFGSINIFKYLWANKIKVSRSSLRYSIIGGNLEIIHILADESNYEFNDECLQKCVLYHHDNILEYLLTEKNVAFRNVYGQGTDQIHNMLIKFNFIHFARFLRENNDETVVQHFTRDVVANFSVSTMTIFLQFLLGLNENYLSAKDHGLFSHIS
ncbi:hypothetical protein TRFO_28467 [Tritrichomonas foetus]|uniref:DUF3447 domain-containing protein n=1 Tax=Tritrichomonas foetus TaxID=1144522 RepID=A0A1J4JY68_9EUKA|nr:hypothetical protein TRFO_28467 [Tritrichomonas foetus]|eukprot:OHT04095.1 hypothetical protein TRFO_28467 [Tritrichomonas foetus]